MPETLERISPAEFFYKYRELPGFSNEMTAAYTTIRELVENSLDACESARIQPEVNVKIKDAGELWKVQVIDNGPGVPVSQVPEAFASFLTSSKYGERQQRGLFGIGGKMALLYSQVTTQKPFTVASCREGVDKVTVVDLLIDIKANKPKIMSQKVIPNNDKWHGVLISLYSTSDFGSAMANIIEYMRRSAIVNPHALLSFSSPKEAINYPRVVTTIPEPPQEVAPHPYGVDAEFLRNLIQDSKNTLLTEFFMKNFQNIGTTTSKAFLKANGVTVVEPNGKSHWEDMKNFDIKTLSDGDIVGLAARMKSFKDWIAPSTKCLSPISEDLFLAGVQSQYQPDFKTYNYRKGVFGGHPFIVETVMAYGGKIPPAKDFDFLLQRFANKIPLIQELKSDTIYQTVRDLNYVYYKIPQDAPVGVWVHLCSTKIPWKTQGKEIIAQVDEVEQTMKNALNYSLKQLSVFVSKRNRQEFEHEKYGRFKLYIPEIARAVFQVTGANEKELTEKMLKVVIKDESVPKSNAPVPKANETLNITFEQ